MRTREDGPGTGAGDDGAAGEGLAGGGPAQETPGAGALARLVRGDLADAVAVPPPSGTERAHPWCSGAVALAGRGDDLLCREAAGWALRYASYDETTDRGVELPRERWLPARPDTVFDLASLTKLFTAIAVMREAERGTLELDAPVARHLPEFGAHRKQDVTVRQLLAHTSGLRSELAFWAEPTARARRELLWHEEPLTAPGTAYLYSDLNFLAAQFLLERVTGRPLDTLVRDGITGPLGMRDTRFAPPSAWLPRIAATEDQRGPWGRLERGTVHGTAHDENAFAFGGVAGHAGLFATAADLGRLCAALLDGGRGVLRPESVAEMFADHGVPGRPHGLGFDLGQPWLTGGLSGPRTVSHTGFTGTSLVIDPVSGVYVILLANAVHPVRTWRRGNAPRLAVADRLAGWVKSWQRLS
ncbi:beta-lactamase family protein [Streptomyces sp. PTM05]|uniref:Beta-lactamase family protein n=1 Tax=Streptantibioticus parmotrematis TaxID=2873249 RepID=A0ABS7QVG5_9ACTN|nr:serine hydrolase domain-containing protein [Streptantibioticus parmotrematis]MBY8886335.1 beta-lactamase family protein [Streptantibioticus parmotrematis]